LQRYGRPAAEDEDLDPEAGRRARHPDAERLLDQLGDQEGRALAVGAEPCSHSRRHMAAMTLLR
jgi:hypothetical protein